MVLVIAEKPSVAKEIARVIGATKNEKGYFSGNGYLVSWCVGHLVELAKPVAYGTEYEKWNLDSLPIIPEKYITEISTHTAEQFNVLKELINHSEVTELVEATDAGREGELIFRLVYDKIGCKKPFKRLWISSIEEESIKTGFANMRPGKDYENLYQSALCRQRADWLVGINFTRLYSKMYNKTLTCGRVQTPTINLIVNRQRQIDNFIPQIYYTITADCGFNAYTRVETKQQAQSIIDSCSNKEAIIIKTEKEQKKEKPTALYDLTTLQRDANRLLGYSAQQTLDIAQKLYDSKLATYPRTDSRYLNTVQEQSTLSLINTLLNSDIYSTMVLNNYSTKIVNISQVLNDKKVTDHHAILPTLSVTKEKLENLPTGEKNILFLLLYRLLTAVYAPHIYTTTKVNLDIAGIPFTATGREEIDIGFKFIEAQMKEAIHSKEEKQEKENIEDTILPIMIEGDIFTVHSVKMEEKKTKPLQSFTEDTLLYAMETAGKNIVDDNLRESMKNSGLGTPATRASIIENIIKIGYINRDGKKLLPTEMANTFIELVPPNIKEPELTAHWELQLAAIQKGEQSPESFMHEINSYIYQFIQEAKASYSPEQNNSIFNNNRENIGNCPKCNKRVLEYTKAYSCESGKNGCGFTLWKIIAGKTLSKTQATKLLTKGKTDLIKGFTSKTGKPFEAYLILKDDKNTAFEFPQKK